MTFLKIRVPYYGCRKMNDYANNKRCEVLKNNGMKYCIGAYFTWLFLNFDQRLIPFENNYRSLFLPHLRDLKGALKGNQTMKLGQLIECNINNIFLEKPYTKCSGETIPRPFSKKLKLGTSLDLKSKVLYSLLLWYGKLRAIEIHRN